MGCITFFNYLFVGFLIVFIDVLKINKYIKLVDKKWQPEKVVARVVITLNTR